MSGSSPQSTARPAVEAVGSSIHGALRMCGDKSAARGAGKIRPEHFFYRVFSKLRAMRAGALRFRREQSAARTQRWSAPRRAVKRARRATPEATPHWSIIVTPQNAPKHPIGENDLNADTKRHSTKCWLDNGLCAAAGGQSQGATSNVGQEVASLADAAKCNTAQQYFSFRDCRRSLSRGRAGSSNHGRAQHRLNNVASRRSFRAERRRYNPSLLMPASHDTHWPSKRIVFSL